MDEELQKEGNFTDAPHETWRDDTGPHSSYPHCVLAVRHLIARRNLVVLLCTATLLLKLLVPTGYMIGSEHGRLAIELCSGIEAGPTTVEMGGMHGAMTDHGKSKDHGKAEMPCAFSSLSAASLGALDPIQLAALVAFIVAGGLSLNAVPRTVRRTHLRPPLRGPPATL